MPEDKKYKKQHIIPQFFLKRFSSEENSGQIRIFLMETQKDEKQFRMSSIRNSLQQSYGYGKSGEYEHVLGDIEASAKIVIEQMIRNPKKFMRKNITLDDNTLRFFGTLKTRSQNLINTTLDEIKRQVVLSPDVKKQWDNERENKEINGRMATMETPNTTKERLLNGKYKLIQVDQTLLLPDTIVQGMIPLTPTLLIVFGDLIPDVERLIAIRSKAILVRIYNCMAVHNATDLLVVGQDTTSDYIKKLKIEYENSL